MPSTPLTLRYAALSDVGRFRKDNQDSGYASERLLVVADGVGGAARGDVASATAVQILRRLDAPPPEDLLEALAGAIHRAHDRIAELVEEDPELEGTSTTVTAALFDGHRVGVGHVGDSRGYLLRDGTLSQLTKDHTFVQSLIDEGRISEEESRSHPHRNLILRAVDGVHETDPDLFLVDLAPGDRILLCSDGCSGVLEPDKLASLLGSGTVDYAVVELVRAALDAGSTDNVTCIVAEVVAGDAPPPEADTLAAATTGPMLVGAAVDQPRRAGTGTRALFRGRRVGDTDEMEPVDGEGSGDGTGPHGVEVVDPEELRYAPRPPRRFVWLRRLAVLVAAAVLLWLAGRTAYAWTQDQYYVAANGDRVAVFRGVEAEVPGVTLSSVFEETDVTLASLPPYHAEQVRGGISAEDLGDARDIVTRLGELVRVCPEPEASPTPTPAGSAPATPGRGGSPSPSPDAAPSPGGTRSPSGEPTATDSATAAASPTLAPPECVEATP